MAHIANVVISNNTQKQLATVSVFHKSDEYRNRYTWHDPINSSDSTETSMAIKYETGFDGASKYWWYVTWQYVGESKVYYTEPKSGQNFFSLFTDISNECDFKLGRNNKNSQYQTQPKEIKNEVMITITANNKASFGANISKYQTCYKEGEALKKMA
jgi:hypothetical protein